MESLHCTPVINIMLYVNYISLFKNMIPKIIIKKNIFKPNDIFLRKRQKMLHSLYPLPPIDLHLIITP